MDLETLEMIAKARLSAANPESGGLKSGRERFKKSHSHTFPILGSATVSVALAGVSPTSLFTLQSIADGGSAKMRP